MYEDIKNETPSPIEKQMIKYGEKMQQHLITKKAKLLKSKYNQQECDRYPKIQVRSKNELAKRLSNNQDCQQSLNLINRRF